MTQQAATVIRAPGPRSGQLPRLVPPGGPLSLHAHEQWCGPLPLRGRRARRSRGGPMLAVSLDRAGLTGRGGAGFPAGRKIRAVAEAAASRPLRSGAPVVVANGVDSEPMSRKDAVLLGKSPHLVLDGIALAAEAVGATSAFLCVHDTERRLLGLLRAAAADRVQRGTDELPVEVVGVDGGYVASEESALVNYLSGGPPLPRFVPPRPYQRGVSGRPTLVSNVETLAHMALIARYGSDWFASVGSRDAPGSTLVTVTGAVARPAVYEVPAGIEIGELTDLAGGLSEPAQAVLAGGVFGGWLPWRTATALPASAPGLRAAGAAFGPGVIMILPAAACGLAETARIARYVAGESAGQCGPCVNGLPAIADQLAALAWQRISKRELQGLPRLLALVDGRGACRLPDGAAGLVASALRTFGPDLNDHLRHGACRHATRASVLPAEVARSRGLRPEAPSARGWQR